MTSLIILIILILAIALPIIGIHNKIITYFNASKRAWADVIAQERQKNNVLPKLEEIVESYKLHESNILLETTKLRSAINQISADDMDVKKLAEVQQKTGALINNLHAVAENYPELKSADIFQKLMHELSELEQNVTASVRIFNRNVEQFNTAIEVFPNSFVNSIFTKKQRLDVFRDAQAESGFKYKPNF